MRPPNKRIGDLVPQTKSQIYDGVEGQDQSSESIILSSYQLTHTERFYKDKRNSPKPANSNYSKVENDTLVA